MKKTEIKTPKTEAIKKPNKKSNGNLYLFTNVRNTVVYFTTNRLKILTFIGILSLGFLAGFLVSKPNFAFQNEVLGVEEKANEYWFLLHRKSNVEMLFKGVPGSASESALVRSFQVKTGVYGQKPTPLPKLLGREYWVITKKYETTDNLETAPYFIELDVPHSAEEPYGPVTYAECNGQCNWELPGPFGLHGINGDTARLSIENAGSSGCIRHTDADITFLYNLIKVEDNIRYYIEDK